MLRERHIIDLFKGLTAPYVLLLMALTDAWDRPTAWVYLGVHGTYGLLWVMKSRLFGDKSWEVPCGPFRALLLTVGLAMYWLGPTLLLFSDRAAPAPVLGLGVALFGLGTFLHFAADMQKTMALELRPGQLFTGRLWARTRNPNYLGELLIYLSFCLLSCHWQPYAWFALVIAVIWVPNMRRKDASMARHPTFAAWKARSGLLFPQLGD